MLELGWSREQMITADPHDVEAARWKLYSVALRSVATQPFDEMRRAAEIDLIENDKSRAREAKAFNKRRVESLTQAEIARGHAREALMLDVDDEDDDAE